MIRFDTTQKESERVQRKEIHVRVRSFFPAENVRSEHRMALSASPRPKSGGIARNPFYSYFFYPAPVIPPAEFFAQMTLHTGM